MQDSHTTERQAGAAARAPRRGTTTGALFAGTNVVLGLWLLLSPAFLEYDESGAGARSFWNDSLAGGILMVVGLVRLAMPRALVLLALVGVGLGAWLLVAPAVLDHAAGPNHPAATVNDIVLGALVTLTSLAGLFVGLLTGRPTTPR
jgi:hypothetical protein